MARVTQRISGLVAALLVAAVGGGCGGGGESASSGAQGPQTGPTYYKDVAPILDEHCVACHRKGDIAPFSLETYDSAAKMAALVAQETTARRMPPWHIDNTGACNTYRDARVLDDAQIATLAAWAGAGAPAGDPADAPAAAPPLPKLDHVDAVLDPGVSYTPDTSLSDDYRCFIVDPKLASDKMLVAYEVVPGQRTEVHHAVVFAIDDATTEAQATDLDAAAAGPGYTCFGGAGFTSRVVAAWAPGTGVTRYPDGSGVRLHAGRKLVVQVHYNLAAGATPDRTTVSLGLVDSVPHEAIIGAVGDFDLNIAPGEQSVTQTATMTIPSAPVPVTVHGVYPHMHRYGRTLRVEAEQGGVKRCMVDVPDWSFSWQQFYFYEQPFILNPGGGSVTITCSYDTTDATAPLHFGEGTGDEMCLNGLYVTY